MASPLKAVGDLLPLLTVALCVDGATPNSPPTPFNLTSVSAGALSLNIYNTVSKTSTPGAGSFTILNAPSGLVQYTWATGDSAAAGSFLVFISLTIAGSPVTFDEIPMTLVAK